MRPYPAFACAILLAAPTPARAQVVLDGTVGPGIARALEGPDVVIRAADGERRGGNLFHSFERFGIAPGGSATFTGPGGIANVIGRVTGGERSDIDGTLRSTIPGADFWFLNPAGVVFGPNARLDVRGSFHVSTADELRFEDGARFSAAAPGASRFTVAEPRAFGFLGAAPGAIAVDRSVLEVPAGASLALVGGDIGIRGGPEGYLFAEGGRVDLVSVASAGEVRAADGATTATELGGIDLFDLAEVNVSGGAPGTIRVRAGAVGLDGSNLLADGAGAIDLEAADVRIGNGSTVRANGDGAGTIRIRGGTFTVDDSIAFADNTGARPGLGGVTVNAGVVAVRGGSLSADALASGRAGAVSITADRVAVSDGGLVSSDTYAGGRGGRVTLNAREVAVTDRAAVLSVTRQGSTGGGGAIEIDAEQVGVFAGGVISAEAFGSGPGGDVTIDAPRSVLVDNGFIGASSRETATETADAGTVTIATGRLELLNEGRVFNGTNGPGDAGDIVIDAGSVLVDGALDHEARFRTGISASTQANSTGGGGDIRVTAGEVVLVNTGDISSGTSGTGDGGAIFLTADEVEIAGAGRIESASRASGAPGAIGLHVGRMAIRDGGFVAAFALGQGPPASEAPAGGIRIVADTELVIAGRQEAAAGVATTTLGPRSAGGIEIETPSLRLPQFGLIDASTTGDGDAGSVTVDVGRLSMGPSTFISSSPLGVGLIGAPDPTFDPFAGGDGGRIRVTATEGIDITGDPARNLTSGLLTASITVGRAGSIEVNAATARLTDAAISSQAAFLGDAGDIAITARDQLRLERGTIATSSFASGGGQIAIRVGDVIDLNRSLIASSVGGEAGSNAGNVDIDPRLLVLDRSQILAQANEGAGGAIDLRFGTLFRTPDSVIDASAGPAGIDGTVRLEGPEENVSGGLTALPAAFLDASALLRESCAARRDVGTSSFTASGRGGLPVGPDAPLPGFYSLGREVPLAGAAAALAGSKPPPLVFEVAGLDRACGGVR